MNSDKASSAFQGNECTPRVVEIAWCATLCLLLLEKCAIIPQTHYLCRLTWSFLPLPSLFRSSQYPPKYRTVYEKILGSKLTLSQYCSVSRRGYDHCSGPNLQPRGSLNDLWSGMRLQAQGEFSKNLSFRVKITLLVFSQGELLRVLQITSEMLSQH